MEALPQSAAMPTRPLKLGPWTIAYPLATQEEIVQSGGAFTTGALIKVTWKLIATTFLLSVWSKIDGDIWSP
jgi:hypothetical protein